VRLIFVAFLPHSLSLFSNTMLIFQGLNGYYKNPTTRTLSILLMISSCSQQVPPFAISFNSLRYSFPSSSGTNLENEKDELLGLNVAKILPSSVFMPAPDRAILPFLFPQTKLRVSPIFNVHPAWHMRNGFILHADATSQHFYSPGGTLSFVIMGVERISFKLDPPQQYQICK